AMGAAGLGALVEFVPYPVTMGFTAGIAVVIGTLQIKDLLGLDVPALPEHYLERVAALLRALPTLHAGDALIGALTLALLLAWPPFSRRVLVPLLALTLAALAAWLLRRGLPQLDVATIGSRFSYLADGVRLPGIPRRAPWPVLPWAFPGPDGQPLVPSL